MKKFLIASVAVSLMRNIALGQDVPPASASPSPSPAGTEETERVIVQSQEMDITREAIVPSLGATRYTVGPDRLDSQAGGENAPFNQTLLRFPGVAQDSFGQLHVRGEHANLQYRIDDVLLPESIPGFGQVLETRFADNISLITGALPAQFGFRNTGVIDIHTKSGAVFQQGDASVYGGSFDTIMPSFEYGVASRVDRDIFSNGIALDASYKLNDQHTLRGGFLINAQHATVGTSTLVFPVDANGNQTSDIPLRIVDNSGKYGYFYGFYLQDEWKPFEQLTINFGGRLDFVNAFADENQLSPRINVVYKPFD